jgi:predicted transcriptional regulator
MKDLDFPNISNKRDYKSLLHCIFNLNDFELSVYQKLLELGEAKIDDISKSLEKERTAVYRSLQKLVSCGLVYKDSKIPKQGGGFYHVYSAAELGEVKKNIEEKVDEWYKTMKSLIKTLR